MASVGCPTASAASQLRAANPLELLALVGVEAPPSEWCGSQSRALTELAGESRIPPAEFLMTLSKGAINY